MAGVSYLVSDFSGAILRYPTDEHINKFLGYCALARALGTAILHPFRQEARDSVRSLVSLKKELQANLEKYKAGELPLEEVIAPFNQAVIVGQPLDTIYNRLRRGARRYAKEMDHRVLRPVHAAVRENGMGTGIISTSYGEYIDLLLDRSGYGADWSTTDIFARFFALGDRDGTTVITDVKDQITGRKAEVFEHEFLNLRRCDLGTTCFMGDGGEDKPVADLLPMGNFIVPFHATEEFRQEMGARGAFVPADEKDLQNYLLHK